jgi:hypothetical protein
MISQYAILLVENAGPLCYKMATEKTPDIAVMTHENKKAKTSPAIQAKLADLEETAARQGIRVHYDRLEAAGIRLKGGICKIRGEYHLFIDRRRSPAEKIDLLEDFLEDVTDPPGNLSREGVPDRSHPRHRGR